MKKFIYKLLILTVITAMIVTVMPLTGIDFTDVLYSKVYAEEISESFSFYDNFEYKIINTCEVEITAYWGSDTEVIIPSTIHGKPVTSVGEYSFTGGYYDGKITQAPTPTVPIHPNAANNKKIQKVVLPSSVKTIGAEAFSFIDNLSEVVLDEGLKVIGEFAFADCPLLTEIDLPDSLVEFNLLAFENTKIKELVLGSNVTEIKLVDFAGSVLERITFNGKNVTIKEIDLNEPNTYLKEIVFNGSFCVEQESFIELGKINKIISKGGTDYPTICFMGKQGFNPFFYSDGSVLFITDETVPPEQFETNGFRYYLNDNSEAVITQYIGEAENIVVPEILGENYPVTALGDFCFAVCYYDGLESHSNHLVKSVVLPDTIREIGICAFAGNLSLESINIPTSLTVIPQDCFFHCSSLDNITIPDNVRIIEDGAFINCENLKSIKIPEKICEIKDNTFKFCSSLKTVEMLGVKKIGDSAFDNCLSLTDVIISKKLTEIGAKAFYQCEELKNIDLSGVTYLGKNSFRLCHKLNNIVLNDNIEHLEYGVFLGCSSLDTIHLPLNLVTIGPACFCKTAFTELVLGEKLKEIEYSAFSQCDSLKKIYFPESLEIIGNYAFKFSGLESVTIPKNVKILGRHAFARNIKLTTLYFNATNCRAEDRGEILDADSIATASPFFACKIVNIYFGADVNSVNDSLAFYGTFESCETIETVTIPDSVELIGTAAFKNCTNLETAVIPDSVEEIADDAFDGCENLTIYCSEESYAYAYASAKGISVSTFVISAISNQVYTGSAIKPSLTVKVSNTTLTKGVDYSVSYSNNINVGQATVVVQGKGDYDRFSSRANFTIVTKNISKVSIADINDQKYTGKSVEPSLTVTDNGRYLKEGKDYTVHYYNNVNQGVANAVITGIGNYSGTVTTAFEITELGAGDSFADWFARFISDSFIRIISFILSYFNR